MPKNKNNKLIYQIDFKYGKVLKILAKEELKRFHSVPLEIEDLYNCFMFEVPNIVGKIDAEGKKFENTLKLYAKRFYFKKCREYTTQKYRILNQAGNQLETVADVKQTTIIEFTSLDYIDRLIYKSLIENKKPTKIVAQKLGISDAAALKKIKEFKVKIKHLIRNK